MNDPVIESKADMLKRLRRIEGQVKGIQKMIDDDKSCSDIITQVSAVRAAINKVGIIILENYSATCFRNFETEEQKERALKDLTKIMQSFMKFSN